MDTYLKNKTLFEESIYKALMLDHHSDTSDINHIIQTQTKITKSKYYLFNLKQKKDVFGNIPSEILDTIMNKLNSKESFSYPLNMNKKYYVVTSFESVIDPEVNVIGICESQALEDIQTNRIKKFFILIFILGIAGFLSNKTLRYAQNLKTEKEKMALALKESKLYFENAMIGFLIVDKHRKILNANPLLCQLFGYSKDELVGKSARVLHTSEASYKKWGKLIFSQAQKKSLISVKYEMRKKDGSTVWVEISGAPFDKKSELYDGAVVWTARDITKQIENQNIIKDLNTTLNEKLEYLRVILDVVPIPIFVKDADNRYVECNQAFVNILKRPKDKIINKKVKDLLSNELAEKHAQQDLKLRTRDSIEYRERYNADATEVAIYKIFKTAIKKDGKNDGYIGAMVDITKHEEQEVYLERKIKEEVQKNTQQAKAYEREKLRDVKFSAIGQLSAGITHEINTPLTYVKGNLEMLKLDMYDIKDKKLQEQLIGDVVILEDGLERIAKIVDSMREMSQQTRETKEEVNVYATLVTALTLAHNRSKQISTIYLNKKEFGIGLDKNEFTCLCTLQKQRIEQVWIVIINNALDELQKIEDFQERTLHINCHEEDGFVIVRFEDNAGGIEESILKDIFEPFISTKIHGGMGVGLSISKKILEEQGATISAFNENEGAVFEVKLQKSVL